MEVTAKVKTNRMLIVRATTLFALLFVSQFSIASENYYTKYILDVSYDNLGNSGPGNDNNNFSYTPDLVNISTERDIVIVSQNANFVLSPIYLEC